MQLRRRQALARPMWPRVRRFTTFFAVLLLVIAVALYRENPSLGVEEVASTSQELTLTKLPHTSSGSRAVIHMGPHKTGTSTIQSSANRYSKQLRDDGYEIPFSTNRRPNQVTFASCFLPHDSIVREQHPCDSDLLISGSNIASRQHDMFVSAEDFARIDNEGIRELSSYLSQWSDVIIILFYRRYYSWLASFYNQMAKNRKLGDKLRERSLLDFIRTELSAETHQSHFYTANLYDRLVEQFGRDKIVVVNTHNKSLGGPDESTFCHAMPNTTQTCNAIRKKRGGQKNVSSDLDYSDLVYSAVKAGLVEINTENALIEVAQAAQTHHEVELNMNSSSFPRVCLSPDEISNLLHMSLEFEKKMFPNTFDTMEDDLKSDFGFMARSKLCKLDTEMILAEKQWQAFFKSRQETMINSQK